MALSRCPLSERVASSNAVSVRDWPAENWSTEAYPASTDSGSACTTRPGQFSMSPDW